MGRKCGKCELGLQGLCKAADRGKVTAGRKIKEEMIVKDENRALVEKIEVTEEEVKIEDAILDTGVGAEEVKPQIHSVSSEMG